jgi:branched-chain amino acid transport system permease protein
MSVLLHALGFGLVTSALIALSAVALSLQWAVSGIPNFAHGEYLTAGAYGALAAQTVTANIYLDALAAIAAGALVAWLSNWAVIEPFIRAGMQTGMLFIVTIGISIVLQSVIEMIFGAQTQTYALPAQTLNHIGPFLWTRIEIYVVVLAVTVMLLIHLVLRYTEFGRAIRSIADSRQLARACGVNTTRVINLTWLFAGGIAGVAGYAIAIAGGAFTPTTGYQFLLPTFAAAVIGGVGRPYGAMIGAVIVGITTELGAAYVSAGYKQVIAVGLLVLVLFVRPTGIFPAVASGGRVGA